MLSKARLGLASFLRALRRIAGFNDVSEVFGPGAVRLRTDWLIIGACENAGLFGRYPRGTKEKLMGIHQSVSKFSCTSRILIL